MATGYAKSTGRLGVCLATSGPGAIHLLNGLYDAKLDHVPVLAITGMQETQMLGTGYQQEVNLEKLFMDVAEYDQMIHVPVQIPTLVDLAVRHALARRTVSHLTVPNDIQVADADADPYKAVAPAVVKPTAAIYLAPPGLPRDTDLQAAAEILNAGERVLMLVGAGALHARQEVLAVAEALGSPIVKTLPGKAVVPDDHPLTTGGIGLLGTKPSEEAVESCDTLLMVGPTSRTPSTSRSRAVQVVQIEADPVRAGNRLPTDVPMVGDAKETLAALLPRLKPQDRPWLPAAGPERMADWRRHMAALETLQQDPIHPQYLMRVIDRLAADDAILASDSGTIATWAARHFDIRGDRQFYLSGNLATMAPGLPYTIAAQWAHPGRQCIAFVGDGGFAMLMAEFDTACRTTCRSRSSSTTTPSSARSCGSNWCSATQSSASAPSPVPTSPPGPGRAATAPRSRTRRRSGPRSRRRWPTTGPASIRHRRRPGNQPPLPWTGLRPGQEVCPGVPQARAA